MLIAILVMLSPVWVSVMSYYWASLPSWEPVSVEHQIITLNAFYQKMQVSNSGVLVSQDEYNKTLFEEADTLRPPKDDFKLSPAEIAEGWRAVKVDGCWIKTIDIDRIDSLEDPFEEDDHTAIHQMDAEYIALIDSLAKDFEDQK